MPTDRRLSNIWFNTEGSLHLISERILLDVALSREGTRSGNSVFSLGPNIIFIQILFNTGCQFGLFHLQQWRRGEISSDGSHPDWQPVSPGKPHLLCFQSLIFQIFYAPALMSLISLPCPLSSHWKVLPNIHGPFQVLPFSKRTSNYSSLFRIIVAIILFSTPIHFLLFVLDCYFNAPYLFTFSVSTTKLYACACRTKLLFLPHLC